MVEAILAQLHDPLVVAIPLYFLFVGIETVAYRLERDEPSAGRGYSAIDTRTNVSMGLGAVAVSLFTKAGSLVLYTALYVYVAPWHAPADAWWTWVTLFVLVDVLWYWYHRMAHRVRVVW